MRSATDRQVERLVAAARALVETPEHLSTRDAFTRVTFNEQVTAGAIVRLADRPAPPAPPIDLAKLDLADGDILMVKLSIEQAFSLVEIQRIREQLERAVAATGLNVTVMVAVGVDVDVVKRAEAAL